MRHANFLQRPLLCVGDGQARADRQGRELVNRIGTPLLVEVRGHMRMPLAGHRSDDRAGDRAGAIDPHRAAEAAADLERRLLRARRD